MQRLKYKQNKIYTQGFTIQYLNINFIVYCLVQKCTKVLQIKVVFISLKLNNFITLSFQMETGDIGEAGVNAVSAQEMDFKHEPGKQF